VVAEGRAWQISCVVMYFSDVFYNFFFLNFSIKSSMITMQLMLQDATDATRCYVILQSMILQP
jgi:hypothetical protein